MPVLQNSLSDNADVDAATVAVRFDSLSGEVVLRGEELEVINRPGVIGSGVRKLAARGKPFELASVVYCLNWDSVKTVSEYYKTLIGMDPLYLVKQDVKWGTFLVLDVEVTNSQAVYSICGDTVFKDYFPTPLEIRLEAKWKLLG